MDRALPSTTTGTDGGGRNISVVIVTWNCADTLERCLQSLLAQSAPHILDVHITDNCSTDETVSVASKFQDCQIQTLEYNSGFAAAANIGIRKAQGQYVFLLNPDAVLSNDVLGHLVSALESVEAPALAGPLILKEDGSRDSFSARRFPSPARTFARLLGMQVLLGRVAPSWTRDSFPLRFEGLFEEVPLLTGAALMAPRSLFEEHGLLDQTIPMYYDDLEICARVTALGGRCLLSTAASVVHLGAASVQKSSDRGLYYGLEDGHAPWLYFRDYRGAFLARQYVLAVAAGNAARVILLGPLTWVSHRLRVNSGLERHLRRSLALLRWAFADKAHYANEAIERFSPLALTGSQESTR